MVGDDGILQYPLYVLVSSLSFADSLCGDVGWVCLDDPCNAYLPLFPSDK